MQYKVKLESIAGARLIAVVRRQANLQQLSKVVPEACGVVWNAIRAQGLPGGRHVSVYLDDEINLEVGVEMDVPFAQTGELVRSALPTGMVATAVHFGPYGGLKDAHQAIRDWLADQGREMAGINWEIYGHWLDEWNREPSLIRTDVYYLVK